MIDSLYLAWRYLSYHRFRTLILVACVTLISLLPLALQLLFVESERQLMSRAMSTPLLIGAKGSSLDLVMSSLYFGDEVPEPITMTAAERVWDSDLAIAVPLYARFRAQGHPIVGTTLDYFDFRGLEIARGRLFAVLGESVLGATVAQDLGLKPGDSLLSSPENPFDLAGVYPLKMKVVGVLQKTHTADDLAVFADLKTAWVIEGLGHGHTDLAQSTDNNVILERGKRHVIANAALTQYREITPETIASFHFHGATHQYPITTVIALPHNDKSATILRGRYLDPNESQQIVVPDKVIDDLLQTVFRIKNVLDAVIAVVGFATVMALLLVFALSLRLRQREIQTIFKIGCRRLTIARLVGAEIAVILILSALLCTVLVLLAQLFTSDWVRLLLVR